MKKFITLLLVSLLVGSIFAVGSTPRLTTPLSTASKLEVQIRVLGIVDRLQITTSQASNLASAMIELRKSVNSLQEQRLSSLVTLRNALLSSNKEKISDAMKNLESISKSYFNSIERFLNHVESTITLRQAINAREFMNTFLKAQKGPLQEFFKYFILNKKEAMGANKRMEKPFSGQRKLPMTPGTQMEKKGPLPQRMQYEMSLEMEMKKENILYHIVNSELYNTIIETLQMKASSK